MTPSAATFLKAALWMFEVFIHSAAIATLPLIAWLVITAQRQNRQMGIGPFQFSTRALLIAITIAALVMGLINVMVENSLDSTT